jgi:hypothetical protein
MMGGSRETFESATLLVLKVDKAAWRQGTQFRNGKREGNGFSC